MKNLTNLVRQQWGKLPSCNHCKTPVNNSTKFCGGACGATFYCNQNCQKLDWQNHKTTCQKIGARDDPKRGRDDGNDDKRRVRQKPEEENVIEYQDLVNQSELNDATAWKLVLRFLNLEDLKNVTQVQKKMAKLARQKMLQDYWVRLPNDLNEINKEFTPLLRNVIVDQMNPLDFLHDEYPTIYLSIRKLIFTNRFDETVDDLPPNLIGIEFGDKFNQKVDNLPNGVTYLSFGILFNQAVDKLPENLTYLILGDSFNRPVDNLPKGLIRLTLGDSFNQTIDKLPSKLKYLFIGTNFNQTVDYLPKGLTQLYLGYNFNQPVDKLPPNLKELSLLYNFNQTIDNLPSGLLSLTLGVHFNQPINNLPKSLLQLRIHAYFNRPLRNLPRGLVDLYLGGEFNQPLENVPRGLVYLTLTTRYEGVIPDEFVEEKRNSHVIHYRRIGK